VLANAGVRSFLKSREHPSKEESTNTKRHEIFRTPRSFGAGTHSSRGAINRTSQETTALLCARPHNSGRIFRPFERACLADSLCFFAPPFRFWRGQEEEAGPPPADLLREGRQQQQRRVRREVRAVSRRRRDGHALQQHKDRCRKQCPSGEKGQDPTRLHILTFVTLSLREGLSAPESRKSMFRHLVQVLPKGRERDQCLRRRFIRGWRRSLRRGTCLADTTLCSRWRRSLRCSNGNICASC